MKYEYDKLESLYKEQEPCCYSCGWLPAFYELHFYEEGPGEYHAACVNPEDPECGTHRGHYLYEPVKEDTNDSEVRE